jgi:hypothetical protein
MGGRLAPESVAGMNRNRRPACSGTGGRIRPDYAYGLEQEFEGQVDFVYLDISEEEVQPFLSEFGFEATPHFFIRSIEGEVVWSRQGEVSQEELRRELDFVVARESS